MEQHYVCSNFVTFSAKMPGFDYWEANRLDLVGLLTLKKAKVGDCKLNCVFSGNKIGQQTVN